MEIFIVRVLLASLLTLALAPFARASTTLQFVGEYPLPGRDSRWDYMYMDSQNSRLYLAHLGDSAVVSFDTKARAVRATAVGVPDVHGVLAVPELNRVYVTATGKSQVWALDPETLKILAKMPTGAYPDGLAYARDFKKLYVSDAVGGSETVIDVVNNRRVKTLPLGGEIGNTKYDELTKRIVVNVQGTRELVEIDPANDHVVSRTRIPGAEGNHGLLIEPKLRLAFVACEENDKLTVLDLREKKKTAEFSVPGKPDVLAYDEGLGLLYIATESGDLHEFSVNAEGVSKLGVEHIGGNAHSVAVDQVTHELYLPVRKATGPVLLVMKPATQPR